MFHTKKKNIAYIAIFAMLFSMYAPHATHAVNNTFTQADWLGGTSVNVPSNTSNQTGWDEYNANDANIIASTDIQLNNVEKAAHIDFNTEGEYVQEDAANGTDFSGGEVVLHGSGISATGGTVTTDGGDTIHTFTSDGTFSVTSRGSSEVLVVAGGGGGGGHGPVCLSEKGAGGGGAGGLIYEDDHVLEIGSYTVTVGAGGVKGLKGSSGGGTKGSSGENSTFDTLVALGGGGGGGTDDSGGSGGSGGGSGGCGGGRGGASGLQSSSSSGGYGNNGGAGIYKGQGGGGGGAGGVAGSPTAGAGLNIHGTVYATGGQSGGSAAGGSNTGNGGAGSSKFGNGGDGGSGVVIVRYSGALSYPATSYYIATDTSSQINTSSWGAINSIDTTQTTPTNTDITYLVSFDNKITWKYYNGSSWQDSALANIDTNGMTKTEIEALTVNEWDQVFTQGTIDFAANLSTTNGSVTPELDDIQINYTLPQTQTLISNTIDTEEDFNTIDSIQWTEILNTNTDVKIQIRTSPDNSTWTEWMGPLGVASYFTDPSGQESLYASHADNLNDRYIQYKVLLLTTDGQNTSIVDDIVIEYHPQTDIIIENPDTTKMTNTANDGYISVDNGTSDNTTQTTVRVNVEMRKNNHRATFLQNTQITERANQGFNFQNFTLQEVNVKSEQKDSRGAVRIGSPGEKLDFSQDVILTIFVGHAYNDLIMDILYQEEGESTWNAHGTCVISDGNCTFTTDHATIYTINGVLQSTGDAPININTEVQDTLTLDCYDTQGTTGDYTVTIGTTTDPGKVTAGTPATGQSTCTVTTNDDQGYYLTLIDDNASANTVLTHTDPHTGSIYEIQDLTQFPATTTWTAPTTKGLGFSVVTFPDTQTDNNTLDETWTNTSLCPEGTNPDTNTYAGIPDTAETISAVTQYESLSTTTNICYKVDVPASQASGQYTGSVTYTATSDASSYLN